MRLALRFLAATLALAVSTAQAGGVPGGYSDTKLTDELSSLLYKALANETVYASGVTSRVCACKISSVQQQVVAGMNYRFTTNACDVQKTLLLHSNKTPKPAEVTKQLGKCKKSFQRNCVEVTATVTVYRSFDDSLKVSSIETTEAPLKQASVHVLRDELFLRLVLELQPHLARPGTRLQVWAQVAEQTNKASKETIFGSREAAKNRLVFLKAVLEDPDHALHSTLSREMRVMLEQIRGEPGCEETSTSRRTRSHRELTTSDEGGAEDTAKASEAKRKRHRLAALDIDQVETPMTRDLVPFGPPPASPRELLDRQLGAQIERDHQSRRERERLQDEVKELRVY